MRTKEYFIDGFLAFNDIENVAKYINRLEAYISKSGYDLQLELILHYYRMTQADAIENSYEKALEEATQIFELLKNTEWGWLEIQVLGSAIGRTPHYTMSEELMQKAFCILDNEFSDHELYEFTKCRFYINLTLRLLRARYYDSANPADIQAKFDWYMQQALSFCEKKNYITYRTILLTRQAIFYGDSDKILECLDNLKTTEDKMWIKTTKDEVVEYFQRLKSSATTDLKNLIVGWQMYKRRIELGISTADLASAIGISSPTTINLYERGGRGVGPARLCKVAEVLGVDISYFYGETNAEPANITTDIITYKMVQLMSQMSEGDKEYLLEHAKLFANLNKKKAEG